MKKNEIFTFTAPNGVEVTGIVVHKGVKNFGPCKYNITYICYAQNRLFTYIESGVWNINTYEESKVSYKYGDIIVEYCVIPELDTLLEDYMHQQDVANDYADKTVW